MCSNPIDDNYYKKYDNIHSLLFKAYTDKYILQSIDSIKSKLPQEANDITHRMVFVLAHICELVKSDLALTIWKVFYDNGNDANTVKSLNRYLFATYKYKYKIIETDNIKKIRPTINDARTGFIAHNLMDDTGRVLQTSDLFNALEDIRIIYNNLCIKDYDSRVEPLSNAELLHMIFAEKGGFDFPIMQILNSFENAERD